MKVRVSYIWDSEANTYHPDNSDAAYDAVVTPSISDRLMWSYHNTKKPVKTGTMPLTRGFEILPYLAGLARDVVTQLTQ